VASRASAAATSASGSTTIKSTTSRVSSAAGVRRCARRGNSRRYSGVNSSAMIVAHKIVP
jgi:hypothetical protein